MQLVMHLLSLTIFTFLIKDIKEQIYFTDILKDNSFFNNITKPIYHLHVNSQRKIPVLIFTFTRNPRMHLIIYFVGNHNCSLEMYCPKTCNFYTSICNQTISFVCFTNLLREKLPYNLPILVVFLNIYFFLCFLFDHIDRYSKLVVS